MDVVFILQYLPKNPSLPSPIIVHSNKNTSYSTQRDQRNKCHQITPRSVASLTYANAVFRNDNAVLYDAAKSQFMPVLPKNTSLGGIRAPIGCVKQFSLPNN